MAKKTINGSPSSTSASAQLWMYNNGPGSDGKYEISVVPESSWSSTIKFNLSSLSGVKITAASISYSLSKGSYTSYCSFGATIKNNGAKYTPDNLKNYLSKLTTFDELEITVSMSPNRSSFSTDTNVSTGLRTASASYSNFVLSVTYESDDATVSYGYNGAWKKCKVYYGYNGAWKPCKAYYGDGTWKPVK